uniref:Large ribosomal subunit protein uL22m n=1 Tax=Plectus sambesii TaxID=2011161 RepID=A0A914US78_9BILA
MLRRSAAIGLLSRAILVPARSPHALCASSLSSPASEEGTSSGSGTSVSSRKQAVNRFRPIQQPYAPEWDLHEGKEEEIEKQKNDPKGTNMLSAWPHRWHDRYGMTPEKWEYYNKVVWPPNYIVPETGKPKAAEVFHCRESVKYSPKKMWYVCELVRNRPVDDALKQLQFTFRKGAEIMIEMLNEAKERAKKEFNIEYPSNTFIGKLFSSLLAGNRKAMHNERFFSIRNSQHNASKVLI